MHILLLHCAREWSGTARAFAVAARGLAASGHVTQIVRERPGGFGFVLFPLLFFFLFVMLMRAAFWGRRWGGPGRWGPHGSDQGGWKQGRGAMFDEWHRRQHDQASGDHPGAGGEPAAV